MQGLCVDLAHAQDMDLITAVNSPDDPGHLNAAFVPDTATLRRWRQLYLSLAGTYTGCSVTANVEMVQALGCRLSDRVEAQHHPKTGRVIGYYLKATEDKAAYGKDTPPAEDVQADADSEAQEADVDSEAQEAEPVDDADGADSEVQEAEPAKDAGTSIQPNVALDLDALMSKMVCGKCKGTLVPDTRVGNFCDVCNPRGEHEGTGEVTHFRCANNKCDWDVCRQCYGDDVEGLVSTQAAPVQVDRLDQWVSCDCCSKWRKIPARLKLRNVTQTTEGGLKFECSWAKRSCNEEDDWASGLRNETEAAAAGVLERWWPATLECEEGYAEARGRTIEEGWMSEGQYSARRIYAVPVGTPWRETLQEMEAQDRHEPMTVVCGGEGVSDADIWVVLEAMRSNGDASFSSAVLRKTPAGATHVRWVDQQLDFKEREEWGHFMRPVDLQYSSWSDDEDENEEAGHESGAGHEEAAARSDEAPTGDEEAAAGSEEAPAEADEAICTAVAFGWDETDTGVEQGYNEATHTFFGDEDIADHMAHPVRLKNNTYSKKAEEKRYQALYVPLYTLYHQGDSPEWRKRVCASVELVVAHLVGNADVVRERIDRCQRAYELSLKTSQEHNRKLGIAEDAYNSRQRTDHARLRQLASDANLLPARAQELKTALGPCKVSVRDSGPRGAYMELLDLAMVCVKQVTMCRRVPAAQILVIRGN